MASGHPHAMNIMSYKHTHLPSSPGNARALISLASWQYIIRAKQAPPHKRITEKATAFLLSCPPYWQTPAISHPPPPSLASRTALASPPASSLAGVNDEDDRIISQILHRNQTQWSSRKVKPTQSQQCVQIGIDGHMDIHPSISQ